LIIDNFESMMTFSGEDREEQKKAEEINTNFCE
jgi:hypothetical protein